MKRTLLYIEKSFFNNDTVTAKQVVSYFYETGELYNEEGQKVTLNLDEEARTLVFENQKAIINSISIKTREDLNIKESNSKTNFDYKNLNNRIRVGSVLSVSAWKLKKSKYSEKSLQFDENKLYNYSNDFMKAKVKSNKQFRDFFKKHRKLSSHARVYILTQTLNEFGSYLQVSTNSFLESIIISNSIGSSGTFNMSLSPVIGRLINKNISDPKSEKEWRIIDSNIFNFTDSVFLKSSPESQEIMSENSKSQFNKFSRVYERQRNPLFFQSVLCYKDVVFVKFIDDFSASKRTTGSLLEKIEISKKESLSIKENMIQFIQDMKDIDFIGTIDSVHATNNIDTSNFEATVEVTGKSIYALMEEDTALFFSVLGDVEKEAKKYISNFDYSEYAKKVNSRIFYNDENLKSIVADNNITEVLNYIVQKIRFSDIEIEADRKVKLWDFIYTSVDKNLTDRKIFNLNLASKQGSVMSFLQEIVRPPLVELFGDFYPSASDTIKSAQRIDIDRSKIDPFNLSAKTFNDVKDNSQMSLAEIKAKFNYAQLHLIIRHAPLSPQEFLSYMPDFVFEVSDDEIIGETIGISGADVVSVFKIVPEGLWGDGDIMFFFPVTIIYEYARRFGLKVLEVQSNMFSYEIEDSSGFFSSTKTLYQAEYDLRRLIKGYLGNLFYNEGQITTIPNRNYRVGCLLKVESTGQIFYINSVSHNRALLEGSTTLSVSRGLTIEGHKLLDQLVEFKNDQDDYFRRKVIFNEDIFYKLLNNNY